MYKKNKEILKDKNAIVVFPIFACNREMIALCSRLDSCEQVYYQFLCIE